MRLSDSLILSLTSIFLTTSLVACNGDDTTNVDEVGTDSTDSTTESTTESGSTDASTDDASTDSTTDATTDTTDATTEDTTDATEDTTDSTETTGGGECNGNDVVDVDIMLALVGSQSPPNGCSDHVFTGTRQGGGGGNWTLDACPCGAQCLVPDPYTLTVITPEPSSLPDVPACPRIEIRRNADCEVASITIGEIDQPDGAVWIGSRENAEPGTVPDLTVNDELVGICECIDCAPPTLYQLGFETQGESLLLNEGEQGPVGDWTTYSFSSHTYEAAETNHFAWIMKR
jgi:hypothetical protein